MATDIMLGKAGLLAPGRFRWARAIGWICFLAVFCILSFNLAADATFRLAAILGGESFTTRAAAPTGARLMAVIMGSTAMLTSYALAVRYGERRSAVEVSLRHFVPDTVVGIAFGALLMTMIVGLLWIADWITLMPSPISAVTESLKLAIQSGVIEELLMRLIIFRLLWRVVGVWPALVFTALLFGGLHLSNPDASLFAALCLVAGEGVGAGLYLLTGRVWMSVGMHAGWNFAQGWLFGSAVSGLAVAAGGPLQAKPADGVATVLSGGGFGPESTMVALAVSLVASALCLTIAWRRRRFVPHDG